MNAEALQVELAGKLFELAIVLDHLMEHGLADRGLTRARATVISQIHERGPLMGRELSQLLGVTPRNVTGLVDGLQKAGLVSRTAHPTDRRATRVELSPAGARLAIRLRADHVDFAESVFRGLRRGELAQLRSTLDLVLSRLHELRSEGLAAA